MPTGKPFNWTTRRDEQLRAWNAAVPPVPISEQARCLKTTTAVIVRRRKVLGLRSDRTATAAAVEAHRVDAKMRRAAIAEGLLEDVEKLRAQLFAPATIFNFGGKDNTYEERSISEPVFADKLKILQAVGVAVDRHIKLVEHDADSGVSETVGLLDGIAAAIKATAAEIREHRD